MELSSSFQETIQHQFDSFCKKVLSGEAKDYKKEIARRANHEVLFSELPEQMIDMNCAFEQQFFSQTIFKVRDCEILINDPIFAIALEKLSKQKRDLIFQYYFLDMSDRQIAEDLKLNRRTVHYKRVSILLELRNELENREYEEKV